MDYRAEPGWALVHEPGLLLVHAGADELFVIDDIGDAAAAELLALWGADAIRPASLSQEAADVFEQLKAAGIVRRLLDRKREYTIAVRFVGSADAAIEAAIDASLPGSITISDEEAADLVLLVRTDGTLADIVADGYDALTAPHLLLDLAYGHTICLGPLVFTQETACLSCLVARLSYYWGDVAPPPRPRMTGHGGLSAGLAAMTIANILRHQDRSLVNRTVSYDFAAHQVLSASVYRVPSCPCCGTAEPARPGSIALPWAVVA